MFNKKEAFVSWDVAERKVNEIERKREKEKSEILSFCQKQKELIKINSNKTINTMKKNSGKIGQLEIFGLQYPFGEETPFYSDGIKLFTGDEVTDRSGRKGVILKRNGENIYEVKTNLQYSILTNKENKDEFTVSKHFNELQAGDVIAQGRSGGDGFLVLSVGVK